MFETNQTKKRNFKERISRKPRQKSKKNNDLINDDKRIKRDALYLLEVLENPNLRRFHPNIKEIIKDMHAYSTDETLEDSAFRYKCFRITSEAAHIREMLEKQT